MFKSIFSKYFTVVACIIVVAFLLLAVTQTFFGSRYWVSEKKELLQENAADISAFLSENALTGALNTYYLPDTLSVPLRHLASTTSSTVLVTNADGTVLLGSEGSSCPQQGHKLSAVTLAQLRSGTLFQVGRLDGLYEKNQYTAGAPLVKNNTIMGYVLLSTSASALQEYIRDNLRVFLLSVLAVLMLTFIALYIMTYRMVRPLRQMASATRQFSRGDFSARVSVRGQDEVAELAGALNNMAVSLSSVEHMRRSFVANISHELRTPMTTIGGFIDGILDGTIPEDKRDYYLHIVSDETKRLSRLVRSMLNLSRIDSGQLKLHPVIFDLTETVAATLLTFEKRIEEKHLQIEGLEDCTPLNVKGDYDLLQQVVYNLIDNAVKFTNDGGTLSFFLGHLPSRCVFTIRNTGEGIPTEELPHIFERFYKSDRSRGLDKSGTGLGLYIVKSIINLHSGEITVRSAEHEYCEFSFWLPD